MKSADRYQTEHNFGILRNVTTIRGWELRGLWFDIELGLLPAHAIKLAYEFEPALIHSLQTIRSVGPTSKGAFQKSMAQPERRRFDPLATAIQ